MNRKASTPSVASSTASPAAPVVEHSSLRDHPIGFWFFFWGEFAERCCYYGMRAILLLYMIQILGFDDGRASKVMSYFIAGCYLLPLVGGYVADNFVGKYRTIVYFSVPYIFGQAILGVASLHSEPFLYLSLALLAMGSGVIKPNISTLMGMTYDQRRPGQRKLRSDAFAMFYGAINIGAALSSFCVPWIRNHFGGDSRAYAIAFLFPTALMILAFIVFALGKPFYAQETIHRTRVTREEWRERLIVLGRLFSLFLVVTVFWSIFDQSVSTWTLFARDFLRLELLGFPLSPDQLQAVNPVLIVVLLPPITMLWHLLARLGWDLRPTSKMLIGFTLTTITMAITAWAAFRGAAAVTAGAPAALAAAETTSRQTVAQVGGEATDTRRVALAAAARAAQAATQAARAAVDARQGGTAEILRATTAAEAVQKAADTCSQAVKAATQAARDSASPAPGVRIDLADCSVAANRAAAAGAATNRAAEMASLGHLPAAEVNAAVASLASADAAVAAARAHAGSRNEPLPAAAIEAVQAAAAARISILWQVIP